MERNFLYVATFYENEKKLLVITGTAQEHSKYIIPTFINVHKIFSILFLVF